MLQTFFYVSGFLIVALSAQRLGTILNRFRLPLISGFLLTGIIAGPYVLGLLQKESFTHLAFIDQISLAMIAFAAGSELYIKDLRDRMKSIIWITVGQIVAVFVLGTIGIYFLAPWIPFMQDMSANGRLAVSLLAGAILIARSPSSAIAIINELRAKGPFTQTVLGVTMIIDVVVIVLFAISSSLAPTLLEGKAFSPSFLGVIAGEIVVSIFLGWLLGLSIKAFLSRSFHINLKKFLVVMIGFGIFLLAGEIHHLSHVYLPFTFHIEALLVCMIGSFYITNYTLYRKDMEEILHHLAPPIYVAFFTLTGASLGLDLLLQVWSIALLLFVLRLATIFLGAFAGGSFAGDPALHNRVSWLTYVTQAGVGLGLAKGIATFYPSWGGDFATLLISVIVINQLLGPPLFKLAIGLVGEAHPRASTPEFDGVKDAMIFGLDGRSVALAMQLLRHGWEPHIVALRAGSERDEHIDPRIQISYVEDVFLGTLKKLKLEKADAVISILQEEDSYHLCELIYEEFGIDTVVALLPENTTSSRFHEIDVRVVMPSTAVVGLLDHLVRSPLMASFILVQDEEEQDVVDFVVRDPSLHGLMIRELHLPSDVLILRVLHKGKKLVSQGHTLIELGDRVTAYGSPRSLEKLELMFEVEPTPLPMAPKKSKA